MKQIITKAAIVLVMGSWTFFALVANSSHDQTCKHEWNVAFTDEEFVAEEQEAAPIGTNGTLSSEGLIPGGLQNFLLQ